VVSVLGLDFLGGGSASNAGVMFARLKPYEARTDRQLHALATVGRLYGSLSAIPEGRFIPLNPPAISGIGQVGGFEYVLEGFEGQGPADLAAAMRGLIVAANQDPRLTGVFSTFEATAPQVRLDIDRTKAETLGLNLSDIFTTLQATLGGFYVNDFNLFGRTWTVRLQAERAFRDAIDDIGRIYVRNAAGEMTPLSGVAEARLDAGPRTLTRYNNYRAVPVNGSPAPGYGPGDATAAMEALSETTLPHGYGYEWTGQALEQKQSAGQTPIVLSLALVFAYLFLVALYESWNVPIAVLLSVVVAGLGALGAVWLSGMSFVIYTQIGLVVLIALAAKNAILINAFALDRRADGLSVSEAAAEGARLRFRPVMMTSFAFIMGLVPLVVAFGPGAGSMVAVGVPVLAGMLAASLVGIFLIPMLFVAFQWLRERTGWRPAQAAAGP
jgi:HAE1 family hydrophobic/amphiphilic exporter-1